MFDGLYTSSCEMRKKRSTCKRRYNYVHRGCPEISASADVDSVEGQGWSGRRGIGILPGKESATLELPMRLGFTFACSAPIRIVVRRLLPARYVEISLVPRPFFAGERG